MHEFRLTLLVGEGVRASIVEKNFPICSYFALFQITRMKKTDSESQIHRGPFEASVRAVVKFFIIGTAGVVC